MTEEATNAGALVDELGERIGDLRAHLAHAHPLRPEWVADLDPAELAAIHRRLHGRAVEPDPSLVDVRLVELRSDPERRATTALPIESALDHDLGRVWLPLRVVDRLHAPDAPGHTMRGGCRACADVVDAVVRSMVELDRTPQARIAELEATVHSLVEALEAARSALVQLRRVVTVDDGDGPAPAAGGEAPGRQ